MGCQLQNFLECLDGFNLSRQSKQCRGTSLPSGGVVRRYGKRLSSRGKSGLGGFQVLQGVGKVVPCHRIRWIHGKAFADQLNRFLGMSQLTGHSPSQVQGHGVRGTLCKDGSVNNLGLDALIGLLKRQAVLQLFEKRIYPCCVHAENVI
jgi:hypothetical protein